MENTAPSVKGTSSNVKKLKKQAELDLVLSTVLAIITCCLLIGAAILQALKHNSIPLIGIGFLSGIFAVIFWVHRKNALNNIGTKRLKDFLN